MVAALYAIAIAMIAGGSYIANAGYEIILVERGWSQVIAGSVVFTGGFILLGVATVVCRLGKINKTLLNLRTISSASHMSPTVLAGETASRLVPPEASRPENSFSSRNPFEPEQETISSYALEEERLEKVEQEKAVEPLPVVEESHSLEEEIAREVASRHAVTTESSEPIVAAIHVEETELANEHISVEESAGAEQPSGIWQETAVEIPETEALQPAEDFHEPSPPHIVVEEVLPEPEVEVPPPTVVGSYDSGGNQYVMYSDGSIEAHLPSGLHRFGSLEELKQFIGNLKAS